MTDRSLRDQLFERVLGVPLVGALLGGIVAFVASYLSILTLAATTGDGIDTSNLVEELSLVGQFFYNSFRVPTITERIPLASEETTADNETVTVEFVNETRQNDITGSMEVERYATANGEELAVDGWTGGWTTTVEAGTTFPSFVYLAVPVIALLVAGVLIGYYGVTLPDERGFVPLGLRSVLVGGVMTLGFLLLALGGMYLFRVDGQDIVRYPAQLETLLMGVLYPLVLGTVGAFSGLVVWERGREQVASGDGDEPSEAAEVGEKENENTPDDTPAETETDEDGSERQSDDTTAETDGKSDGETKSG